MAKWWVKFFLLGLVKKTVIPFLTEDSILRLLIEILAGIIETEWY